MSWRRILTTEEERVSIDRAKTRRLRIPRTLNSGRVAKLKAFKTRITDWATPSLQVFDEPIIVTLKKRRIMRVNGEREWFEERTFDHFHPDVIRFEELIDRKKGAGYVVTAKDAVLAYLLVFKRGSPNLITGFLNTFPQWKGISVSTVRSALSRLTRDGWFTTLSPEEFVERVGKYIPPLTKYPPTGYEKE